jgi:membrane protein DedA with SNARE-associated domain
MSSDRPRSHNTARVLLVAILIGLLSLAGTAFGQHDVEEDLEAAAGEASHDLEAAVQRMQPLVERYGYIGVAGAVFVEGSGIPAPGQSFLMAGSLEATRGHMHMALLFAVATLAAVLGNSLGYLIGKRGGRPLLRKLRVNEAREAKLAGLFDRYSGGFILLARFFDGPRQLNGILAGTFDMPWWLFTVFNVIGAALWVSVWGLGTFYLSEHLHAVDLLLRQINPWIATVVVTSVIVVVIYLFRGRRQTRPRARGHAANEDRP